MFVKTFIILFVFLPTGFTYAANPNKSTATALKQHISEHPGDSTAFFNLALIQSDESKPGLALAQVERSLFLNPLNFKARSLKNQILETIREKSFKRLEEISTSQRILDALPSVLILIITLALFLGFALSFGKLKHKETKTFKNDPQGRIKTGVFFAFSLCFLGLLVLKQQAQKQVWACVTSKEASLYTGPDDKKLPKVSSLSEGDCSRVVSASTDWISLKPQHQSPGWTKTNQVLTVRGNKFDPLFNKD